MSSYLLSSKRKTPSMKSSKAIPCLLPSFSRSSLSCAAIIWVVRAMCATAA